MVSYVTMPSFVTFFIGLSTSSERHAIAGVFETRSNTYGYDFTSKFVILNGTENPFK